MCLQAEHMGVRCEIWSHPAWREDVGQTTELYELLAKTMSPYHSLLEMDTSAEDFFLADGIHIDQGGRAIADAMRTVLIPEPSMVHIERAALTAMVLREALRRREQRELVRVL